MCTHCIGVQKIADPKQCDFPLIKLMEGEEQEEEKQEEGEKVRGVEKEMKAK